MSNDKTAVAKTAETSAALAMPDWMKDVNDQTGTEHLTREDVTFPRLGLAQQMSHELDPSHQKYIENLKVGDLFNTVTGEILGRGPRKYAVIRADKPRYIEFFPRSEGGGVKDMNVPADDPRTQFGPGGEVPIATKFYDYVLVELPLAGLTEEQIFERMIGFSLKSTGLKVAKQLNTALMYARQIGKPSFSRVFEITTGMDQNKHGKFAIYVLKSAGFIQDELEFKMLAEMAKAMANREVKYDRSEGGDDQATAEPGETGAPKM